MSLLLKIMATACASMHVWPGANGGGGGERTSCQFPSYPFMQLSSVDWHLNYAQNFHIVFVKCLQKPKSYNK